MQQNNIFNWYWGTLSLRCCISIRYSQLHKPQLPNHIPLVVFEDLNWLFRIKTCRICPGGATSPGCSGVLQLLTLRLSHHLHYHPLPHSECEGVLWGLLEGENILYFYWYSGWSFLPSLLCFFSLWGKSWGLTSVTVPFTPCAVSWRKGEVNVVKAVVACLCVHIIYFSLSNPLLPLPGCTRRTRRY